MGTYEDVAEKYNVTPDQVKQLKNAMCATWGCIAGDWYNCFGGESEAYDAYDSEAEMIAEATIDADRIRDYSQDDMEMLKLFFEVLFKFFDCIFSLFIALFTKP